MRMVRSTGSNVKYSKFIDYENMLSLVQHMVTESPDMAQVVFLTPQTAANKSIIALELHSDTYSKKPGILVIGSNVLLF